MYFTFFVLFIEAIMSRLTLNAPDVIVHDDSYYLFLIVFNSVILFINLAMKLEYNRTIFHYIFLAYILRLFFMFWSNYYNHIFVLPNSGADEYTYYYNAMSAIVKGEPVQGYALVYTYIAKYFGLSKIFGQYINVLISIFTIYCLHLTLKRIDISQRYRNMAILIISIIPNYAIISSLLLRESLLIAFLAISLYFFVRWWKAYGVRNPLYALIFSLLASWLHSGVIVFALGLFIVFSVSKVVKGKREIHLLNFRSICLLCATLILGIAFIIGPGSQYLNYFSNIESTEDIVDKSAAYVDGDSAYEANIVEDNSVRGLILNSPIRMLYFILSPMPWDWRGINDIIAFVFSGLFYAYSIVISIKVLMSKEIKNRSLVFALVIIAILTMIMFGWGVSNSGTALRHRDKFIVNYVLLLVLSKDALKSKYYIERK